MDWLITTSVRMGKTVPLVLGTQVLGHRIFFTMGVGIFLFKAAGRLHCCIYILNNTDVTSLWIPIRRKKNQQITHKKTSYQESKVIHE